MYIRFQPGYAWFERDSYIKICPLQVFGSGTSWLMSIYEFGCMRTGVKEALDPR